ncbi:MAG: PH domain-containing protein [Planctomycetota bacterium]|jgi:putative membrane protein
MKLQQDEEIIHELRPEPQILWIWFFSKSLPFAPAGFGLTFMVFMFLTAAFLQDAEDFMLGVAVMAAALAAVAFLVLAFVYCVYLRRSYVYYVTNQRCVFKGGILLRIERSVPYHKVTDVEMRQNIIERILGISKLNIFTPGTASVVNTPFGGPRAEISFVGLADSETPAATINETLRKFRATGE